MNTAAANKDPFAVLSEELAAGMDDDLRAIRGEEPLAKPTPIREPFRATLPERKPVILSAGEPHRAPAADLRGPQGPTSGASQDRAPIPAAAPSAAPAGDSGAIVAAAAEQSSDVQRFLATGTAMFDQQRRNILEMESAYEKDRVALIDDYRVRLRELEHEASEALREFDHKHDGNLAGAKRILEALAAMRG